MRILVVRIGAIGDAIITTPLIKYLKTSGNEVYYLGSEQSEMVLKNNPYIDKFILYPRNSVDNLKLLEHFKKVQEENKCDKLIDLCESIEVKLAITSDYPEWNLTKQERKELYNFNYYEYTFRHANIDIINNYEELKYFYKPQMFFTNEEEDFIFKIREGLIGKKIIMWGLSGSGRQKTYPYVPYVVADILKNYKNVVIILVGGDTCKVLECGFPNHPRIMKKCGEFNFRQSALMSKYSNLVISPDTGFLHAAGCFDTPKIGLLTHTTIENITKHFTNDYSIESQAFCAPCFRLITDADNECPIEKSTRACICMTKDAMKPELIYNKIKLILDRSDLQ